MLLYFLFSFTTNYITHTKKNISKPIISTSTTSSIKHSTNTNFQKTINISQPFTNQNKTFSFKFITPYHIYKKNPTIYQNKISTIKPKTTNKLSKTIKTKNNNNNNILI